nr:hypothetical protein [Tanacetum cinerariifolium]
MNFPNWTPVSLYLNFSKKRIRLTALTKQWHSYIMWHQSFHPQTINSERLPILEIKQPFKMVESQFNKYKEDKLRGEGYMAKQYTQPKRPRNYTRFKEKLMLVEAQEAGQILNEEQLAFIADPRIVEAPVA